jgi:transposase
MIMTKITSIVTPDQRPIIAVDVSKLRLDVRLVGGKHIEVENSLSGFRKLAKQIPADAKIVLEATGGYEMACGHFFIQAGYLVCRVNPLRIRRYAEAAGQLAKTDKLDVDMIYAFAAQFDIPAMRYEPQRQRLMELQRFRDELIRQRIAISNGGDRRQDKQIIAITDVLVSELKAATKTIDQEIRKLIKKNPDFNRNAVLIASVPGIGPVISTRILAEFPELAEATSQQAVALAGLAPMARQSGETEKYRRLKGGRPQLKSAFFMAALCAIRHQDPYFMPIYRRMLQRGKAKMVALMAIARKILKAVRAVIIRQSPWQKIMPS